MKRKSSKEARNLTICKMFYKEHRTVWEIKEVFGMKVNTIYQTLKRWSDRYFEINDRLK